jgi:hypothetical protein
MAITLVQAKPVVSWTSAAYTSNVTAGNLLVLAYISQNAPAITLTDTVGTTWFSATSNLASGYIEVYLFYGFAVGSGANTITVTGTNANTQLLIAEFTGFAYGYPTCRMAAICNNWQNVPAGNYNLDLTTTGYYVGPPVGTILPCGPGGIVLTAVGVYDGQAHTFTGAGTPVYSVATQNFSASENSAALLYYVPTVNGDYPCTVTSSPLASGVRWASARCSIVPCVPQVTDAHVPSIKQPTNRFIAGDANLNSRVRLNGVQNLLAPLVTAANCPVNNNGLCRAFKPPNPLSDVNTTGVGQIFPTGYTSNGDKFTINGT